MFSLRQFDRWHDVLVRAELKFERLWDTGTDKFM